MLTELVASITQDMLGNLNNEQLEKLTGVLMLRLAPIVGKRMKKKDDLSDETYIEKFIAAKRVEGCSGRTLLYYETTLTKIFTAVKKGVRRITTDDLRTFLDQNYSDNSVSKVTVDNIRRILSSFYSWLEEENFIIKSPMRRIHKVRTGKKVKDTYTDEMVERMRDAPLPWRDVAMVDLLSTSGIRVGELINLNKSDINFETRECVVFGKGSTERRVYFDARTKLHLQTYLASRTDTEDALFVTLIKPIRRLQIPGVEIRLRKLGAQLEIPHVHPHKFRRTLATKAIDRGMPIEQVQKLLGHQSVDTTLQYAMVNQNNVKLSHQKFLS